MTLIHATFQAVKNVKQTSKICHTNIQNMLAQTFSSCTCLQSPMPDRTQSKYKDRKHVTYCQAYCNWLPEPKQNFLKPHQVHEMWIVNDDTIVCLSRGLRCVNMAEQIHVLFGVETYWNLRNTVSWETGVPIPNSKGEEFQCNLCEITLATCFSLFTKICPLVSQLLTAEKPRNIANIG